MSLLQRVAVWGSLVKFSHSVFALPFALIMIVLVAQERAVTVAQISLLIVCVVSARTAAMAFNRYVDAEIDARNPRTAIREIPAGAVGRGSALALVVLSCAVFVVGAWGLGTHCLVLSPLVLVVLLGYSLMKRFSSWCHVVLGLALALAPGGVWYALTAEWSWRPVPLMVSVVLWVAGFDILYSCQDAEFDRGQGLFSVPSVLGIERATKLSAFLHGLSVVALAINGVMFRVGGLYWLGVGIFAVFLISQHRIVRRHGLSSIDQVFFSRNGAASIALFLCVALDAFV
jgi:4-hydroxybenzoate polyprenyltransferase